MNVVADALGQDQPYAPVEGRWTTERIWEWYNALPWLAGTNYYPATAINQLDMWQAETWDPDRISLETRWAADLGFNTQRVYLHDLVWADDASGLYTRMDQFLDICQRHNIRPFFVFFDDCHAPYPQTGRQPDPVPAYHNSGWVNSPARDVATEFAHGQASEEHVARLRGYVQETIRHFQYDERVLLWELYNEPGQGADITANPDGSNQEDNRFGDQSARLLQAAWEWARAVNPSQPVSSSSDGCIGDINWTISVLNSDVQSVHHYGTARQLCTTLDAFEKLGRPVILTEYLARQFGNTFQNILPLLKERRVGAVNWGFVAGKSGTIWNWESRLNEQGDFASAASHRANGHVVTKVEALPEPDLWFHDILRFDGSPYDPEETRLIQALCDQH